MRDNGVGIDPAYAEFVFGMFKRLHGKKSRHGHWARTLQEGSGTLWQTHLGGIGSGAWCHLQIHHSHAGTGLAAAIFH